MAAHAPIDIHAHYYPEGYLRLIEAEGGRFGASCEFSGGRFRIATGRVAIGPLPRRFTDLDLRIADMDETGVSVQALSLTVPMVDFADGPGARALAAAFNDGCADAHSAHPDRLVGLAALPWHAPDLAVAELDRAAGLPGIRGVYAPTHVLDRELGDAAFYPVYERMEALGLPLFLHPVHVVAPERLARYYLTNLIGNPTESGIAAAHLVFSGTLDRFPRLAVCLPHAGGIFPWVAGRLDHGSRVRPELAHHRGGALGYLRRFHYDTVSHSADALAFLIGLAGADRVMLGSDYCFDMGHRRPVEVVAGHAGIGAADAARILGGNARALLGLPDAP